MTDWAEIGRQVIGKGAPILGEALGGKLGGQAGGLLAEVLGVPASPDAVSEAIADADPDVIQAFETNKSVDLAAIVAANNAFQLELAKLDKADGFFSYGWRPAMSWALLAFWGWSLMLVPLLNSAFHAAIPAPPTDSLLGFTTVWLTIYSGGNTLLRATGKK